MHARGPVWNARCADRLSHANPLTGLDGDALEIRNGHFEAGDWLDSHGEHASDVPGERDTPRGWCADRSTDVGRVVDSPVTPVLADWGIATAYFPVDRRGQANRRNGKNGEHLRYLKVSTSDFRYQGVAPLPSDTDKGDQ